MITDAQVYELRKSGMQWPDIGAMLGYTAAGAYGAYSRHMRKTGAPALTRKIMPKSSGPRKTPKRGDAKRWDKMHCGKGMVSEQIAKAENVDVELVRKTLLAYRRKMWG